MGKKSNNKVNSEINEFLKKLSNKLHNEGEEGKFVSNKKKPYFDRRDLFQGVYASDLQRKFRLLIKKNQLEKDILIDFYNKALNKLLKQENKFGISPENLFGNGSINEDNTEITLKHNLRNLHEIIVHLVVLNEVSKKFKITFNLKDESYRRWDEFIKEQNLKLLNFEESLNLNLEKTKTKYKDAIHEQNMSEYKYYLIAFVIFLVLILIGYFSGLNFIAFSITLFVTFAVSGIFLFILFSHLKNYGIFVATLIILFGISSVGTSLYIGYKWSDMAEDTKKAKLLEDKIKEKNRKNEFEKKIRKAAEDLYDKCQIFGKSYDDRC